MLARRLACNEPIRLALAARPRYTAAVGFLTFEKRWLLSIFQCVIPSGQSERLPEGAADVPMDGFIEDLLAHAPAKFCLGLRACVWVVTLAPLVLLGRFKSFHQLDEASKLALLERMRGSDVYLVREMPLLFKTIGCLGYAGMPQIHARLEIEPRDETPPDWASSGGAK